MKNRLIYTLILGAISSQVLLACTNREVPVTKHDGPVLADEVVVAPSSDKLDIKALREVNPNSLNAKLKNAGSGDKLAALNALAPFILDRTYVENPRVTNTKQMREALFVYVRALVGDSTTPGLAQLDPKAAAPWIERTRVVIESGCDGTGGGCSANIRSFFRREVGSSKIMMIAAQAEDATKNVALYYRRLKMAYELKNRTMDRELEFMYLSRASQYAQAFNKPDQTVRERQLLAQHVEVFETVLAGYNPDLSKPEFRARFETFVNNFGPWQYSLRSENPFGRAATRMLSLAAKNFLYTSGEGGNSKLSPSLEKAIADSQKLPTPAAGLSQDAQNAESFKGLDASFALVVNQVKTKQTPIWKNLALNDSFKRDEYFFIIDRIFGDHLTTEDASEIWMGTRQDQKALLNVAEQYVKIQIAAQIVRTNSYMAKMYSNREWSSTTLLEEAVKQSYPVETQWKQLLGRINRIHLFLDRSLKSTEDIWGESEFSKVDTMFKSIDRNIKYLSVYPNMMLMAYYMAEAKFKLPLYTFFGKIDIDSSMIISWFFDGKLAPFFNFGNDGDALKRIETLYAFLFALQTDTFASFSASRGDRLDAQKFFSVVIGKFLDENRIELSDAIDELRKELRQNTISTFLKTCAQDADLLNKGQQPGTAGARLPLDLWHFRFATYVGSSSTTSYGYHAMQFHAESRSKKIRELNSTLRAKLEFVSMMTGLLEEHMKANGATESESKKLGEELLGLTKSIRTSRAELLTEIVRWNKTLSNCIDQSVGIEIDRQGKLLTLEEKHLRSVWAKIKEARGSQNKDAIIAATNKEIAASTDVNNIRSSKPYVPKSHISDDNYVYADLDVVLRMVQHMKKVAPNVDIIMPSDLSDSSIWKSEGRRVIPYVSSEEEFVKAGMKNFDESTSSIMAWLGNTNDPGTFIGRMKLLVELYKLGPMEIFDTTADSCKGQADVTKCPTKTYEMNADEVASQITGIVRLLSLTEKGQPKPDARIMDLVGAPYRWDRDKLKKFTLDDKGDPITLFESTFEYLLEDETLLTEAKDFNLTNRSIGDFLFSPHKRYRDVVSNGFQPSVDRFYDRGNKLIDAIKKLETADGAADKIVDYSYEIKPSGMASIKIERENSRTPIYFARDKISEFETHRKVFDRETGGAFKNSNAAGE